MASNMGGAKAGADVGNLHAHANTGKGKIADAEVSLRDMARELANGRWENIAPTLQGKDAGMIEAAVQNIQIYARQANSSLKDYSLETNYLASGATDINQTRII